MVKKNMKLGLRKHFWTIAIFLIFLGFIMVAVGIRMTGHAVGVTVASDDRIEVTRYIENNESLGLKIVQLNIQCADNVLAIQESFDCDVDDKGWTEPEIYVYEYSPRDKTWILGNKSANIVTDMFYSLPIDCVLDEDGGVVYLLDEEDLESFTGGDSSVTPDSGTDDGPGGSGTTTAGTTTAGTTELVSKPIVHTDTKEDFKIKVEEAARKVAFVEEHEKLNMTTFLILAGLGVLLVGLVVIGVLLFLKKPKQFSENRNN